MNKRFTLYANIEIFSQPPVRSVLQNENIYNFESLDLLVEVLKDFSQYYVLVECLYRPARFSCRLESIGTKIALSVVAGDCEFSCLDFLKLSAIDRGLAYAGENQQIERKP